MKKLGMILAVLLMAWNGTALSAGAEQQNETGEQSISVKRVYEAPEIDGVPDAVWEMAEPNQISHMLFGEDTISSEEADFSAQWRALWDDTHLYMLIEVTDDQKVADSDEAYLNDSIEVFIDGKNDKADVYDENDRIYEITWSKFTPNGVQKDTETGWTAELAIEWSLLEVAPKEGDKVGIDVHVSDDDDGGDREAKITWNATVDEAWKNPALFGTVTLLADVVDEPVEDTETEEDPETGDSTEDMDENTREISVGEQTEPQEDDTAQAESGANTGMIVTVIAVLVIAGAIMLYWNRKRKK